MYSVILLAAMTAPADAPAWGHLFRRDDCCECGGYSYNGCRGYNSCNGCCGGYACNGCGGYSCHGCCGGYAIPAGYSCGGCSGCGGFRVFNACHGAGACWGYAYAGAGYGFAGCYGSCYGSITNYFSYWSHPANVQYGYGMPMHVAPPVAPGAPPAAQPAPVKPAVPAKPEGKIEASAPATVVVSLPSDAVLFANGIRTTQTSAERHFVTPALAPGQMYHYVLTAEVNRDNKPVTETYQVEVKAGAETRVTFAQLISASPPDASRIASK
jgi:uncharacterized protein (TIGR03000 family)